MQQAQNLGSIMQFDWPNGMQEFVLKKIQQLENRDFRGFDEESLLVHIKPFIKVLGVLTQEYEAVAANPPYMQSKIFNSELKQYAEKKYPTTKNDLCTVFFDVGFNLLINGGFISEITMQSWMFLSSFKKLRMYIVSSKSIISLIDVGWNLFDNHSFPTAVLVANNSKSYTSIGSYVDLTQTKTDRFKETEFWKSENRYLVNQDDLRTLPNNSISYWLSRVERSLFKNSKLSEVGEGKKGLSTGRNELFIRAWSEIDYRKFNQNMPNNNNEKKWYPLNKGGIYRKWYGCNESVIDWSNNGQKIKSFKGSVIRNESYYFKSCITWGMVSYVGFSARFSKPGFIFEGGGPCLFTKHKNYILGLLSTKIANRILHSLNPSINYNIGDVENIPFVKTPLLFKSNTVESSINISQEDWDCRETSWDFKRSPLLNMKYSIEQAYQSWKEQASKGFFQLHLNEEELNHLFIDIYGLDDEYTPEVLLKDITILQEELDRNKLEELELEYREKGKDAIELPIKKDVVMQQLISYAIGCMMGRYRLDKPGLQIAHPNPNIEEVCTYEYNGSNFEIDDDAIIPLMGKDCSFSDDAVNRFNAFIDIIWGATNRTDNINFLQECLNDDINTFITKYFWKDHCKRYKKKPIYWLFASKKGSFQVLVYMHRMNRFTVEKIRTKYLLPHLRYLHNNIDLQVSKGSSISRDDARKLDKLRTDLVECEEYDMLLKDKAEQQIEFDLDDGVTENYKLFEGVVGKIK